MTVCRKRSGVFWRVLALALGFSGVSAQTLEGAVGVQLSQNLSPPPGQSSGVGLSPVGYVNWGRWSLSSSAGLIERRKVSSDGGLSAQVGQRGSLSTRLGLRLDRGREAADDPRLAGMGDIAPTIRGRGELQWRPTPDWVVTAGASADLLGHGHGVAGDAGASRSWAWSDAGRVTLGGSLGWADQRYMQRWYGVSDAQALSSVHPAFRAHAGVNGVGLSLSWQKDLHLDERIWALFAGLSFHRRLGDALDSPLTLQRDSWSARAGVAWRF